jgi:trehalose 6-phosphate synthase
VDRLVESRIDRERASVVMIGRQTMVRPYPISIEWPPSALSTQASVPDCRAAVRQRFGLANHVKIAVGIERLDYTKGILERMKAVDSLLTRRPSWKGQLVLLQAAAPTRSRLAAYHNLQQEAARLAEEVNTRHGDGTYKPIILISRHHRPSEVFELLRAADACIVSSLHDGMNLVAKEFVAARDDNQGVLILSAFAGAACELSEAILINPFDTDTIGCAIEQALLMPTDEQCKRMALMRDIVRRHNVYRWAGRMLLDATSLKNRLAAEQSAAVDDLVGVGPSDLLVALSR